jgi:hypothetical protein
MLAGVVAAAVVVGAAPAATGSPPVPSPQKSFRARVVNVSDGDTFGMGVRPHTGICRPQSAREDPGMSRRGRQ